MRGWILAAGLLLAGLGGTANAGTPYPVKMKCPVGGESFTFISTHSMSTWGRRPDGKPYASWEFPNPVPECPGNRLVMFKEFSKDEIKALKPLLASEAYRALGDETTYYRIGWLAKALNVPDYDYPWLMLQASWQADGDEPRKARYQREYVAMVDAAPPGDPETWVNRQVRAVNAERELGQFDAATKRIAAIREDASWQAAKPGDEARAKNERDGILSFLDLEARAIARKDVSSEPLDLITPRIAADRCLDIEDKAQPLPELCKAAPLSEMVGKFRAIRHPPPKPPAPAEATSPSTPGP